jgi:gas vesicle protein
MHEMEAIKRVFKFSVGGAFGAAIGAGVAAFLAPQRGEDLQAASKSLVDQVKADGEAAKAAKEQEMMNRFRSQVNDNTAFTEAQRHQAPKQV